MVWIWGRVYRNWVQFKIFRGNSGTDISSPMPFFWFSTSCMRSRFGAGVAMSPVLKGLLKSWMGKASLKKPPNSPFRMLSWGSR